MFGADDVAMSQRSHPNHPKPEIVLRMVEALSLPVEDLGEGSATAAHLSCEMVFGIFEIPIPDE